MGANDPSRSRILCDEDAFFLLLLGVVIPGMLKSYSTQDSSRQSAPVCFVAVGYLDVSSTSAIAFFVDLAPTLSADLDTAFTVDLAPSLSVDLDPAAFCSIVFFVELAPMFSVDSALAFTVDSGPSLSMAPLLTVNSAAAAFDGQCPSCPEGFDYCPAPLINSMNPVLRACISLVMVVFELTAELQQESLRDCRAYSSAKDGGRGRQKDYLMP